MTKNKAKYQLSDITLSDMALLTQSCNVPDKTLFCFGKAWFKLYELELIDEENQPTTYGRALVKHYGRRH